MKVLVHLLIVLLVPFCTAAPTSDKTKKMPSQDSINKAKALLDRHPVFDG